MNFVKNFRIPVITFILLANIGCDQITKKIARESIEYRERITIIEDHFLLTKIENTGAFLSLGNDLPESLRFILLTILPVIVLLGLLYFLIKNKKLDSYQIIGFSFILGGGIGNLYDRILYGSVTDFLFMDFYLFKTGIFNAADVSIVVGTGLLIISGIINRKQKPKGNLSTE